MKTLRQIRRDRSTPGADMLRMLRWGLVFSIVLFLALPFLIG
jgi:hypothetical protein